MEPIQPQPRFDLQLRLVLPYPVLDEALKATVAGREVVLTEGWLPQRIRITGAEFLPPQGGRLSIRVHFSGTFGGSLLLSGQPALESPYIVRLAQPDYRLDSQNLLLRTARWMLDRKIHEWLGEKASFDLKPLLDKWLVAAGGVVREAGGWKIGPSVEDLSLTGLEALEEGMVVMARSAGGIKVWPPRS